MPDTHSTRAEPWAAALLAHKSECSPGSHPRAVPLVRWSTCSSAFLCTEESTTCSYLQGQVQSAKNKDNDDILNPLFPGAPSSSRRWTIHRRARRDAEKCTIRFSPLCVLASLRLCDSSHHASQRFRPLPGPSGWEATGHRRASEPRLAPALSFPAPFSSLPPAFDGHASSKSPKVTLIKTDFRGCGGVPRICAFKNENQRR